MGPALEEMIKEGPQSKLKFTSASMELACRGETASGDDAKTSANFDLTQLGCSLL